MDPLMDAPNWLMRPLPANAAEDEKLHARIDKLCKRLPASIVELGDALKSVQMFCEYDAAANRASAQVWRALDQFYGLAASSIRSLLLDFARQHMCPQAQNRIIRRLAKDPSLSLRRSVRRLVQKGAIREVALPLEADGDWDAHGWLRGHNRPLARHRQGRQAQTDHGVPRLAKLADLRKLLGIGSEKQLGWFLLATDADNGPYSTFTIPKRAGTERLICAPKAQLRWVQRHILDKILSQVAPHDGAHGFVPGRSTVTNAAVHTGAAVVLKFDLVDFFPTIHYYRVVGLFASLGYHVGDGRFSADDDSKNVAPTLARLCCYTPDSHDWDAAKLPQGAPTSPAISNLCCRRLDARLLGLAERNQGKYTRYADDLTFSFEKPDLSLGRFRWWVDQICHQEGFFVNQAKFRVIRAAQRQVVTGIVVNDELRVPREERRRFRAILHNCQKHGIASQAKGHKRFKEYLRGFASYVHMVQPEEGEELLRQVDELLGTEGKP
jgi:RNA-directed DNA polymerase